jgi:ribonuclease T2
MLLTAALTAVAGAAVAQGDGFVAFDACEAYQSKNRGTNPGGVRIEPGAAYDIVGGTVPAGDYLLLRVPGAPVTQDRWVRAACGVRLAASAPEAGAGDGEARENVLALSWQPAFCETRPGAAECRALNRGRLPEASARLSVHGLWPQPDDKVWCGVAAQVGERDEASRWSELPPLPLDRGTRAALEAAMPGAASFLDRHEWLKHGTCYRGSGGAEEYVADMLGLADAVNASPVGALFAAGVGGWLEADDIRAAFDAGFGPGAGARVTIDCIDDGRRRLIGELKIHLRGRVDPGTPLSELIAAADPVRRSCRGGFVDPAGLQ